MSTFSESTEFKSSEELEAAVSAEASHLTTSVSTEMKFSIGKQKGKKNTNMEVNIVSSGGDPASILKGDLDAWLDSAKKEPVLSSFSLAPISDLAIRGSTAETLLLAEVEKLSRDTLDNFQSIVPPVRITRTHSTILKGWRSIRSSSLQTGSTVWSCKKMAI